MQNIHITMDSFGSELPENWEKVASLLNGMIDKNNGLSGDELEEYSDLIWENYCAGMYDDELKGE